MRRLPAEIIKYFAEKIHGADYTISTENCRYCIACYNVKTVYGERIVTLISEGSIDKIKLMDVGRNMIIWVDGAPKNSSDQEKEEFALQAFLNLNPQLAPDPLTSILWSSLMKSIS